MTILNRPRNAPVYGIDLGKNLFHVVGIDEVGKPVQKARFRRETLLQFFERAAPALVGMEACPGSQWLARKLVALGHTVRIIPAQFVKPYVKSNKSDLIDAAAIAEAVTRSTMRFVEVRTPDQIDLQARHRVRDRMVAERTALICQMRAFCMEYGIAIHQGAGKFKADLPRVLSDETNDLTRAMRQVIGALQRSSTPGRTVGRSQSRNRSYRSRQRYCPRLMTVPGIGPLTATALLAAAGSGRQFRKARDMAAWLGLVPS